MSTPKHHHIKPNGDPVKYVGQGSVAIVTCSCGLKLRWKARKTATGAVWVRS